MTDDVPQTEPALDKAAQLLEAELHECHTAVMSVFQFAYRHGDSKIQLEGMKAASRMMQASAAAASALARLKRPGTHHTVTVRDRGRGPTPGNLKTNIPQ
jgi:hypothetical protein